MQVKAIAAEIGVGFLGCGVDPLTHQDDIEYMPKRRYGMLDRYLISRNGDPALTREWLASITSTQVRGHKHSRAHACAHGRHSTSCPSIF